VIRNWKMARPDGASGVPERADRKSPQIYAHKINLLDAKIGAPTNHNDFLPETP